MEIQVNCQIINKQKKLKSILKYVTKAINLKAGC